jgi:hypothetical protein
MYLIARVVLRSTLYSVSLDRAIRARQEHVIGMVI